MVGDTGGTVHVIGTPAEEAAGGKVYMAARGAFEGLDAAMMVHPGNRDTAIAYALACLEFDVEFFGKAAHAAARPEAGLNALDAMVAAMVNVGLLRQQVRDTARIHGIITDGGQAVNVIPDHTAAKFLDPHRRRRLHGRGAEAEDARLLRGRGEGDGLPRSSTSGATSPATRRCARTWRSRRPTRRTSSRSGG